MAKRIIFIHGRAKKPSEESLMAVWYDAVKSGLQRDYGDDVVTAFEDTAKDFVYYGDISNAILGSEEDEVESRIKALEELKKYEKGEFNRNTFNDLKDRDFLYEAIADTISGGMQAFGLGVSVASLLFKDLDMYWDNENYFGSDLRQKLLDKLGPALMNGDEILLVAHSLGSIIAYDTLWKLSHYGEHRNIYGKSKKIDLLLTIGSPLADENVKSQLKGQASCPKQQYPANIKRWINIAAEDDYIAHDSRVANDFKGMVSQGLLEEEIKDIEPIYNLTVRKGNSNPHSSLGYLINPHFSSVVADWLKS